MGAVQNDSKNMRIMSNLQKLSSFCLQFDILYVPLRRQMKIVRS